MKCGSWHFTDFRKGGIALQMQRVVVYMHALVGLGDLGDMRAMLWAVPMALPRSVAGFGFRNKFRSCKDVARPMVFDVGCSGIGARVPHWRGWQIRDWCSVTAGTYQRPAPVSDISLIADSRSLSPPQGDR
ncbi:hypothetical protein [Niabella aurantiaca]|uniref:hypothetical protein n=1 Tax=Niabella aurantiaca TaxID=379900 RepID=UPI00039E2B57|nr:hypothetical protein [Niabella aurantiaca]